MKAVGPDTETGVRTEVITVSEVAREFILETRAGENDAEHLGLFLEVSGHANGEWAYDMWFQGTSDAAPSDAVGHFGELTVVVPAASIANLQGATLDIGTEGLLIVNPNVPPSPMTSSLAVPKSDLSSPIELRVLEILESEVNPQIASHGGRADLIAVDEGIAYLVLSGGCQGCGMAQVTLSQGIKVAIQEALPEIREVVDVTAHDDGTNPYYAAAKK